MDITEIFLKPGDVIGYWTILGPGDVPKSEKNRYYYYKCRCVCGKLSNVKSVNLLNGTSKSCGCRMIENRMATMSDYGPRKDRSDKGHQRKESAALNPGERFGRWTVLKRDENRGGQIYYLCRCDCGIEKPVAKVNLVNGTSGGCSKCGAKNRKN